MQEKSLSQIYDLIKNYPKDTVIGEFAGRDSVAAILKAMEDSSVNNILPIASFAPTEYGDFDILESNYEKMVERAKELYGNSKTIFPLIYYSDFDLWSVLNGRFVDYILKKYEFYTPCMGCHAYFHLLRIPIAIKVSNRIIAGERESHDGRIKLNQIAECLDAYERIAKDLGTELMMPIRYMEDGDEVKKLIGWNWEEGKKHQTCAFSGNYKNIDDSVNYDKELVKKFIDDYLYPASIALGKLIINEENPTREKMVQALKNRGELL